MVRQERIRCLEKIQKQNPITKEIDYCIVLGFCDGKIIGTVNLKKEDYDKTMDQSVVSGRQKGSLDKKPRKTEGYTLRYNKEED